MSEHVSSEIGKALAAAGLVRARWQVGDWCVGGMGQQTLLVLETGLERAHFGPGEWLRVQDALIYADRQSFVRAGAAVWLPRADQLLAELAQRKAPYTLRCISLPGGYSWMLTVRDRITGNGPDLAEAAGLALLAVLQEEVQG